MDKLVRFTHEKNISIGGRQSRYKAFVLKLYNA